MSKYALAGLITAAIYIPLLVFYIRQAIKDSESA